MRFGFKNNRTVGVSLIELINQATAEKSTKITVKDKNKTSAK